MSVKSRTAASRAWGLSRSAKSRTCATERAEVSSGAQREIAGLMTDTAMNTAQPDAISHRPLLRCPYLT